MTDAQLSVIPIMFSFTDPIEGLGFIARVKTNGRAVVEKEDERCWWINGVTPGGVCAYGDTVQAALDSFRLTYRKVLLDCAARCRTFEDFRAEVGLIFSSTTDDIMSEWQQAALMLRNGASAGPLEGLAREPSDSRRYEVTVELIRTAEAQPQRDGDSTFAQAA